ncbi:armadillo-type protein [Mycena rebaudengoi]|nr:armadillo-type protein [Mycena rebaudengoi]
MMISDPEHAAQSLHNRVAAVGAQMLQDGERKGIRDANSHVNDNAEPRFVGNKRIYVELDLDGREKQEDFTQERHLLLEPVAPLPVTANRWNRSAVDPNSPECVDRKVRSLLNKLSMANFDSISDQIIEWANKSKNEKDRRTLLQVVRLVLEQALDAPIWSEAYARLCRKMMEQISPKVQDEGIKDAVGKPIVGDQLFRKYLLNHCQEEFERGFVAKEATAATVATKAMEDKAAQATNEQSSDAEGSGGAGDEIVPYSDEYYAQKAKRHGLGLIKFIAELYKLRMLTPCIMHEVVKKLLVNVEKNSEEQAIESLCKLISTVGLLFDTRSARAHMDVYFSRMKELAKSNTVSPRVQFMFKDLSELRDRKWIGRTLVAAPLMTIAAVHEAAAKERASQERETYQRQISMSRGGSRRGGLPRRMERRWWQCTPTPSQGRRSLQLRENLEHQ